MANWVLGARAVTLFGAVSSSEGSDSEGGEGLILPAVAANGASNGGLASFARLPDGPDPDSPLQQEVLV